MNRYFAITVVLAVCSFSPAHAGVMLLPGADEFRVASVTDLEIGGVLYSATFEHGINYDEFLLAHPDQPTFVSDSLASEAILALRGQLNAAAIDPGIDPDALFTRLYVVPQFPIDTSVIAASDLAISQSPLIYGEFGPAGGTSLERGGLRLHSFAWVSFTPSTAVVPEPSSVTAWSLFLSNWVRIEFSAAIETASSCKLRQH